MFGTLDGINCGRGPALCNYATCFTCINGSSTVSAPVHAANCFILAALQHLLIYNRCLACWVVWAVRMRDTMQPYDSRLGVLAGATSSWQGGGANGTLAAGGDGGLPAAAAGMGGKPMPPSPLLQRMAVAIRSACAHCRCATRLLVDQAAPSTRAAGMRREHRPLSVQASPTSCGSRSDS